MSFSFEILLLKKHMSQMLENKKGIIFGVANKRSIAWATAQALHEAGAESRDVVP